MVLGKNMSVFQTMTVETCTWLAVAVCRIAQHDGFIAQTCVSQLGFELGFPDLKTNVLTIELTRAMLLALL